MNEIEIGEYLICHRNELEVDLYNLLSKSGAYRIGGVGSTMMQHFINPYTNKYYESIDKYEQGFNITINIYDSTTDKFPPILLNFSTHPKSDVFYGKWFFNDEDYTNWKREQSIEDLVGEE